jgi:quinol monooxygenase YgiN
MASSLSVHVKAVIDPAKEEDFLKALEPTFKNITAEPLNIFAEIYKDPQNPGVFMFIENWNATLDHMMNVSYQGTGGLLRRRF